MRHRLGLVILAAAATAGGCVHQDNRPDLTGPSTLAQSVTITANPDVLYLGQNGPGQSSTIVVRLFDETGAAETQRVNVLLDIMVGSTIQDCGTLSNKNIQTGSDGIATATYTAPRGNPLPVECSGFSPGQSITIRAIPVGTNFENAQGWTVEILLVTQGVIQPPADTPTPNYVFAPGAPAAGIPVQFDASSSCAGPATDGTCSPSFSTITSYNWNFGDGGTASGRVVSHTFGAAQTYSVTLTVTNDRGVSASITKFIPVGPPAPVNPTATFTATNAVGSPPGHAMNFNATSSTAVAPATITNYAWNFGDGAASPTNSVAVTSHTYAAGLQGTQQTVTLTVTDSLNRTATTAQIVTVP